jgi:hypothetical protein
VSNGPVAQLNSASDFGSEGWGFESLRGHYKRKAGISDAGFYIFEKPEIYFWDLQKM